MLIPEILFKTQKIQNSTGWTKMRASIFIVLVYLRERCSVEALGSKRYLYAHLLINPGLTAASSASSENDCYNQCAATTGCSAVSYQRETGLCVSSLCASLHAVKNTGWSTLIIGKKNYT